MLVSPVLLFGSEKVRKENAKLCTTVTELQAAGIPLLRFSNLNTSFVM